MEANIFVSYVKPYYHPLCNL